MAGSDPDPINTGTATPAGDQISEVVAVEQAESIKEDTIVEVPILAAPDPHADGWGSKLSYILTLIGYAVGFGNIWRFPYLFHNNGGVAFLIPYVFMLAFLGIPMFFLELAIGQRLRKGTLGCWNEISPYLGGIGVTAGFTCVIVGLYYTALIGYCLSYLFDSFRGTLRWKDCDFAVGSLKGFCDLKAKNNIDKCFITPAGFNFSYACNLCKNGTPSQYYWYHEVLNISDGIANPGKWNWFIAFYVVLGWMLIWAILVKGVKATGKVVYFTALFPYAILLIFLIFAFTLPGMANGYRILLNPNWAKLADGEVWMLAGTQIFFSLGLAFGSLIVFASYLPSNNNCYKDAIHVSLCNCATSIFASMVIFPILGFAGTDKYTKCNKDFVMRNATLQETSKICGCQFNKTLSGNETIFNMTLGIPFLTEAFERMVNGEVGDPNFERMNCMGLKDINDANFKVSLGFIRAYTNNLTTCLEPCKSLESYVRGAGSGQGLIFIAFAEALTQFPAPQFWSFLLFMMLLTLGIDSGFGTVEGGIAVVTDLFKLKDRAQTTTIFCAISCVFSMLFCCGWGQYVVTLLDQFVTNWCLLAIAFFECIGISWVYGLKQFAYDIKLMTGQRPNVYLLLCWKIFCPAIMFVLFVASVVGYFTQGQTYEVWVADKRKGMDVKYPTHIIAIGSVLTVLAICWIPLFAILTLFKVKVLHKEVPAYFPEDELREERNIVSDEHEAMSHTALERAMYWGQGELRRPSQATLNNMELGSDTTITTMSAIPSDQSAGSA